MMNRSTIEARIADLARLDDEAFDAPRVALYLSSLDHAEVALGPYEAHLDELTAGGARARGASAESLAEVVSGLYAYTGDRLAFDDAKNADLIHVIDRRRGLPVALGLLYLAAAQGMRSRLTGLAFPGHFLMRFEDGSNRAIIDPFNDGRVCTPSMLRALAKRVMGTQAELDPGYFSSVSPRAVVIRLLANLRQAAVRAADPVRALEIVRRMTLVAPRDARLWADLAELHASSGNLSAAKAAFERSIDRAPNEEFKTAAQAALISVTRKLN